MKLRLGTRGSDLALWQAHHVADALGADPAVEEVEIVVLSTTGDEVRDRPLQEVPGQGFFTARLEQALLDGEIDLAVHSHKDMAFAAPPGLVIAAVPARGPVAERLLIHPEAHDPTAPLLPLQRRARVGTSAPRRAALLAVLRHDLEVVPLRGNVPTRVERVREHRLDAVLLADAGLTRLGLALDDLRSVTLPTDLVVPSPAQGALAVQIREADAELAAALARTLHHAPTAELVSAERAILAAAGGGCHLALGALVQPVGEVAAGNAGADLPTAAEAAPRPAPPPGAFRADLFLGKHLPGRDQPARWIVAHGDTPRAAADAAWERALTEGPTHAGPLAGLRVALVGGSDGGTTLAARLEQLGARVDHEKVLAFRDVKAPELPALLARLKPGDALAVTSSQAARRLEGHRVPAGVTVAAVGPSTAKALVAEGIKPDIVGRGGARELAAQLKVREGGKVLFPCGEGARPELPEALAARGVRVDPVVLYRTVEEPDAPPPVPADVRVFMSPSAVSSAVSHDRLDGAALRLGLGSATCDALADERLDHERPRGSGPDAVVHLLLDLRGEGRLPRAPAPESEP